MYNENFAFLNSTYFLLFQNMLSRNYMKRKILIPTYIESEAIWNITLNICIFVTSHNIIPNIKWILKKRMIGILWWHALYKNKKIFVPNSVFVILFSWDAYQLITHPTVLFLLRIHCSKMRNSLEQCAERPRELIVWAYKWNANMHYLLLCTGTTW